MKVDRVFSVDGIHPFDQIQWDIRTAQITDEKGKVVFRQENVEVPSFFSQLATNIVASKYFYGDKDKGDDPRNGGREHSVKQLVSRVADTITDWGIKGVNGVSYFDSPEDGEIFRHELTWLLVNQYGAFNSPVWFNLGLWHKYLAGGSGGAWHWDEGKGEATETENSYQFPQISACFIISVEDTMASIMERARAEASLFKFGSGAGSDNSRIRSSKEKLSGGGKPSGPLSFMKIYDSVASVVKCVSGDTRLNTDRGIIRIGDLAANRPEGFSPIDLTVADGSGLSRATLFYVNGQRPTKKMTLGKTGISLVGTGEHPVRVLTPDFRLEWRDMSEIQVGDRVAVGRGNRLWANEYPALGDLHSTSKWRSGGAGVPYVLPDRMSDSLGYLLGYLASEGNVDEERIRFCTADRDVMDHFLSCFEDVFSHKGREPLPRVNPKTGVTTWHFTAQWHDAASFLCRLGADGHSASKRVPPCVLQSPESVVRAYLAAYFEGDGHIGRNVYAVSKSPELIQDIQLLLLNFGIVGYAADHHGAGKVYRRIGMYGDNANSFVREIGFLSNRKRSIAAEFNLSYSLQDSVPYLAERVRTVRSLAASRRTTREWGCVSSQTLCSVAKVANRKSNISYANLEKHEVAIRDWMGEFDPDSISTLDDIMAERHFWDEVVAIEDGEPEPTFDLHVPETHSFIGNGVVCHNSGGVTRRAAKMEILRCDHPDIFDFVDIKLKEEAKAHALIREGYESNFNGEAYSTVCFQNSNLSVRVTDEFLKAVENRENYSTVAVTTGKVVDTFPAIELMDRISLGTWKSGDPGLQYDDTIEKWNTTSITDLCRATNPCSEFVYIDDTSCNLASINLMKFRKSDGGFDDRRFRSACRIFITAQEILVDNASYPTKKIAENSHKFRPLGLGYANLGSLLMANGVAYDSEAGRYLAGAITAIMHGEANLVSVEIAKKVGPYDGFPANREPMTRVMGMHRDACVAALDACCDGNGDGETIRLWDVADGMWNRIISGLPDAGIRNGQVSVLAPTGTIAFLMDCDTTGVEPDIALVKYKSLAGGGMLKIVNRTIPMALKTLGYNDASIRRIVDHVEKYDTIEDVGDAKSGLDPDHLPIFDCAFKAANGERSIHWRGHVLMMAAIQPFLSGAISKTVNMPNDATVEDIREAYLEGWRLGLKALAIYRDGSKMSQPLNTKSLEGKDEKPAKVVEKIVQRPTRERLPETRQSITHKFDIQGHEGYVTVGLYPDGRPGEIFVKMAKEGSTIGGFMDVFGTSVSIGLQYGVPLSDLIDKFEYTKFEPAGYTKNEDIRIASSIPDYIFRWLKQEFPNGSWRGMSPFDLLMAQSNSVEQISKAFQVPAEVLKGEPAKKVDKDANTACPICGGLMVPTGRCHTCPNCAYAGGCG